MYNVTKSVDVLIKGMTMAIKSPDDRIGIRRGGRIILWPKRAANGVLFNHKEAPNAVLHWLTDEYFVVMPPFIPRMPKTVKDELLRIIKDYKDVS